MNFHWAAISHLPVDSRVLVASVLWTCGADPNEYCLRECTDGGFVRHDKLEVVDRSILGRCDIVRRWN